MCIAESLPRVDYKKRLLLNLDDIDNPAEDLPSDADIHDAALNGTPLDGDFINQQSHQLTNAEDEIMEMAPWAEYEEIFTAESGAARREDRPTLDPTLPVRELMHRWYKLVQDVEDPEHELGPRPVGFYRQFRFLVREHLPIKLTLDSWVGQLAMDELNKDEIIKHGVLLEWRPWMGMNEDGPDEAGFDYLGGFIGAPGQGRLVWRRDMWGVPKTISKTPMKEMIARKIRGTEDNLVRLSIRIANWLAYWLVQEHAHKMMHLDDDTDRPGLDGGDILKAVVEILGDEWFELPCDHEGKLKSWKHKRSMRLTGERYNHIMVDQVKEERDIGPLFLFDVFTDG